MQHYATVDGLTKHSHSVVAKVKTSYDFSYVNRYVVLADHGGAWHHKSVMEGTPSPPWFLCIELRICSQAEKNEALRVAGVRNGTRHGKISDPRIYHWIG